MILVFGSGGQLGQELRRSAELNGVYVQALTRAEADIADPQVRSVIQAARPSLVVNAAAYTQVDRAETEIDLAERANALGPAVLAEACAAEGVPLVHISTDYVFNGTKSGSYVETDPVDPLGVYGRSKAAGEEAVRQLLREHVILRTSWVYGPFGFNFLKTMLRLARERTELRIVADQRGCPTSTRDLAEAIFTVASICEGPNDVWGTYHFAGTGVTTWHGFAERVVDFQAAITGLRPAVMGISTSDYPTAARRPANSELCSDRFAETFGFRAEHWESAVARVVQHLLSS